MPENHHHSIKKQGSEHPKGVKLPVELLERLEKLGKLKERSTHWLMKQAIERYVETEEQLEALKRETIRRWEEEAELNDIVENAEVMKLLDNWSDEKDTLSK